MHYFSIYQSLLTATFIIHNFKLIIHWELRELLYLRLHDSLNLATFAQSDVELVAIICLTLDQIMPDLSSFTTELNRANVAIREFDLFEQEHAKCDVTRGYS